MSFMEDLRANRQKFLDGLEANQGDINLDIFEDFYPDKAHFVFELLQNAEDTEATRCTFTLTNDHLEFRHNGRKRFSEDDIRSITGIHNSTKTKSSDKIGKFGVGFKSVFIYTLTPQIHSGEYSFSIKDLVMPELIGKLPDLGRDTVFCFPFNNPQKKTASEAYTEIKDGLEKLSELTLLFLKNITSIAWIITGHESGKLYRVQHPGYQIEVIKSIFETPVTSSNFLRFSQAAKNHESQHVCIAFPLARLDESGLPLKGGQLHEDFMIVPAKPGRVSVFFPAEKEASGLRFHIHGPFVPTLDRSSVKDTDLNDPLFDQIASFTAECLHVIRDLKLLSPDFLGVLPNPQDNLAPRYEHIREEIVREMNQRSLTPKHDGGYAPAGRLLQAKANLKEILDEKDLKLMVPAEYNAREWAVAATQKNNNVDRFLNSLKIRNWGIDEFSTWLKHQFHVDNIRFIPAISGPYDEWLMGKSAAWIQKFYSVLYREYFARGCPHSFKNLRLIRLTDGQLSEAQKCYFIDDSFPENNLAKWVPRQLFNSGTSLNEQKDSYSFLEEMGVRQVGERERVELLLKSRYQTRNFDPKIEDIKIFLSHLKSMPKDLDMFRDERILKSDSGTWSMARMIYIDEPFSDTGLAEVYASRGANDRFLLSMEYLQIGVEKKEILGFAEALGAVSYLQIIRSNCRLNPEWGYLNSVLGQKSSTALDQDFFIHEFQSTFDNCSLRLSTLVWDTLTETTDISKFLVATFRKNMKGGSHQAASQFVHQLRTTAWVPQRNSAPVTPPCADYRLLPDGFPFEPGWKWVEAVHFGNQLVSNVEAKEKEDAILRKGLGIEVGESLEDIRRFVKLYAKLAPEQRRKHLENVENELNFVLPENDPKNPDMRRERVGEEAKNAPERETEKRERSVSVGREAVKEQASQYLLLQYTNEDQAMICQVCQRELPFRRLDGEYYFETVEFISDLNLRHHQNYLALCPNHAAMFKHANASKDELKELFLGMGASRKMDVDLADTIHSIYFTETHKVDFAAVIAADSTTQIPPAAP